MLLNYEELFKPYTGDGHVLERTIRWLHKIAAGMGIRKEIVGLALESIFMEMAQGREFPKDKCPCNCGVDKAATALEHALRDRMIDLDKHYQSEFLKQVNERHNAEIIRHIEIQNEEYTGRVMPSEPPPTRLKRAWTFMTKPRLVPKRWRYK